MKTDENLITECNCRTIKIGILGAPINNGNMGCLALTYSLLSMLEEIAKDLGTRFIYYDFESVENSSKTKMLCQNLGIEEDCVKSYNIYPVESFLGFCHRPHKAFGTMSALKECDLFIDLTQGDSFADIYGNSVFDKNANGKLLIEKWLKKPLILGPQTYGPYKSEKNRVKAKRAIENAMIVIARDMASANYVNSFSNKIIHVTSDLAFRLPYKKANDGLKNVKQNSQIRVGVTFKE